MVYEFLEDGAQPWGSLSLMSSSGLESQLKSCPVRFKEHDGCFVFESGAADSELRNPCYSYTRR
ncbi:hypothetical protein ACLOJK_017081 [Asimina triloba]